MQNFKTKQDKTGYSGLAKVFHWSFVAIFAYGIYKQVDNISQLGDSALFRFEVIFAVVFLILLGARFLYMSKTQTSSLPESTSAL